MGPLSYHIPGMAAPPPNNAIAAQPSLFSGCICLAPMVSLEKVARQGLNPYLRCVRACLRACVPACLRACVPAGFGFEGGREAGLEGGQVRGTS